MDGLISLPAPISNAAVSVEDGNRTELAFTVTAASVGGNATSNRPDPYTGTPRTLTSIRAGMSLLMLPPGTGQKALPARSFVITDAVYLEGLTGPLRIRVKGHRVAEIALAVTGGWSFYVAMSGYMRTAGAQAAGAFDIGGGEHAHQVSAADIDVLQVSLNGGGAPLRGYTRAWPLRHTHPRLGAGIQSLPVAEPLLLCQRL
jgi:hypothetical protein